MNDLVVGDAEGVTDAGVEVWGGDFVFDDGGAGGVCFAVDVAAFGATASHDAGEGFGEVVSSALRGKFWGSAKLGGEDDEGAV